MALTQKQKIIGGVGILAALGLLMGAKAQDDGEESRPKPEEDEDKPEEDEDKPEEEEEEKPPQTDEEKGRHPGSPPRGNSYDADYWGADSSARRTNIRQYFADLGYAVAVGDWPMNILGEDGAGPLILNEDGTFGKLGGNDDTPNDIVRKFQTNYNDVSWFDDGTDVIPFQMGGLDEDGLVGPLTLNALRSLIDAEAAASWPELVTTTEG